MAKQIIKTCMLFFAGCIAFGILYLCTGCCSTKRTDTAILEYQKQIDRLEEELRNRDRAIGDAIREIDSITERSRGMEATIDDIILELDEYQRAVERLLHNYYCSGTAD